MVPKDFLVQLGVIHILITSLRGVWDRASDTFCPLPEPLNYVDFWYNWILCKAWWVFFNNPSKHNRAFTGPCVSSQVLIITASSVEWALAPLCLLRYDAIASLQYSISTHFVQVHEMEAILWQFYANWMINSHVALRFASRWQMEMACG